MATSSQQKFFKAIWTTAENAGSQMVDEKEFFILSSQLFCNVQRGAKNNRDLNTTLIELEGGVA
jgi:hypothetical protein